MSVRRFSRAKTLPWSMGKQSRWSMLVLSLLEFGLGNVKVKSKTACAFTSLSLAFTAGELRNAPFLAPGVFKHFWQARIIAQRCTHTLLHLTRTNIAATKPHCDRILRRGPHLSSPPTALERSAHTHPVHHHSTASSSTPPNDSLLMCSMRHESSSGRGVDEFP
jgi:hypothetical protein